MKIFKKEHQVILLAREYLDAIDSCVDPARAVVLAHLEGDTEKMAELFLKAGNLESRADELRREIADLLYSGAYMPLMRGDIFHIIEALDAVPNAAEACAGFFFCEKPEIPEEFNEAFVKITNGSYDIVADLRRAAKDFFKPKGKMTSIREHVRAVGMKESEIDDLERDLTVGIFAAPALDLAHKMHLKKALDRIVHLPDRAEDAAEVINVVAMKSIL